MATNDQVVNDQSRQAAGTREGAGDPVQAVTSFVSDLNLTSSVRLPHTQQSLLERLGEINDASKAKQLSMAKELLTELFGSSDPHKPVSDRARTFIFDVTRQFAEGTWQTPTNFNPNGFFKMTLGKAGKTALRLHFNHPGMEPPESGRIEENIHDHRWSFASVCLTGTFEHAFYKTESVASEDTREVHKYEYAPRNGSENFEMIPQGTELVREVKSYRPPLLRPFQMSAWSLHRASYPEQGGMTVTAVITVEDKERSSNFVWADDEVHRTIQESGNQTPTPKCGPQIQTQLLLDLMKTLKEDVQGR